MITGKEANDGVRIGLHNLKECNENSDRGAAVHRLCDDDGLLRVREFCLVEALIGARDNEYLSLAGKQRTEARARLIQ